MYEKSLRICASGTPRLTTISMSLRMRATSSMDVKMARPSQTIAAHSAAR
jgi:hypothetical protein